MFYIFSLVGQIIFHIFLFFWPIVAFMSPMVLDAPGSENKISTYVLISFFITYPIFVVSLAILFDWRLFFVSPKILFVIVTIISVVLLFVFGIPSDIKRVLSSTPLYGYHVSVDKKVYYSGESMGDAVDPVTFTVFSENDSYAKDKNHVYYRGKVFSGADPGTFELLSKSGFSRDESHVYYSNKMVSGADPGTFVFFNENSSYTHDKNFVYYYSESNNVEPIPGADVSTFSFVPENVRYARDIGQVYYNGLIVSRNPSTFFMYSGSLYAKDSDGVYYEGVRISGTNPDMFQLVSGPVSDGSDDFSLPYYMPYAKDDRHVYFNGKILPGADPSNFYLFFDEEGVLYGQSGESRFLRDRTVDF
ncbi:MAG: DKNYY domain-containing protein [Candidatus Moranbacteria bacterium]|nr:DKNYY domain-containing protein [Candidatus Moranbacteria bacterium]